MTKAEHYYQRLYEVAAVVNSIHASGAILRAIVVNVARALEAKGCSLMLLTPDGKRLRHTAAYGLSERYIKKGPVAADKSLTEALGGKPVAVLDATQDERVQYREQAKREGIASILAVPMRLREKTIGVVRVYTAEPRQFTAEDSYFVSAAANLGAIALENARLYDAVRKDYDTFRRETVEWGVTFFGDELI